jgi:hypothetical protein
MSWRSSSISCSLHPCRSLAKTVHMLVLLVSLVYIPSTNACQCVHFANNLVQSVTYYSILHSGSQGMANPKFCPSPWVSFKPPLSSIPWNGFTGQLNTPGRLDYFLGM